MIWREPQNHINDCHFCIIEAKGFNTRNKATTVYLSLEPAIRPVHHGADILVPVVISKNFNKGSLSVMTPNI